MKKYKVKKANTLQATQHWNILSNTERADYLNQIKRIETIYYDEFDTCRERLDWLVIALNDFYSTIAEARTEDLRREGKLK